MYSKSDKNKGFSSMCVIFPFLFDFIIIIYLFIYLFFIFIFWQGSKGPTVDLINFLSL